MGTSAIALGGGGVQYLPSYSASTSATHQNKNGSASATSPVAASKVVAAAENAKKATAPVKPQPAAGNSTSKPTRAMSHMVVSYNPQGKVRIKYEDSNNNVIYQIPPEMVAKTQDLMTNSQTANIKA